MERKVKTVDTSINQNCNLCYDQEDDTVVTSCGYVFCKSCPINFGGSMGPISCPWCSKPHTVDLIVNKDDKELTSKTTVKGFRASSILNRIHLDDFHTGLAWQASLTSTAVFSDVLKPVLRKQSPKQRGCSDLSLVDLLEICQLDPSA